MTQKQKDFLTGLFKVTFGWDEPKVAALFNADGTDITDDALNVVLEADKSRMKVINDRITADAKKNDDLGYKRATKEIMTKFEDELKEAFEITSDKKGLDLLKHVVTEKSKGSASGGTLTEDEVRKSPTYLALERQLKDLEKNKQKEIDEAVKAKEMEYKAKDTEAFVRKAALKIIRDELKPVLPLNEDGTVNEKLADKMLSYVVNDIMNGNGWQVTGEGDKAEIIPTDKDGKPLLDDHGRTQEFKSIVTSKTTEALPLQKSENKNAPRNPNNNGGGGAGGSGGGADEKMYLKAGLKPAKDKDAWSKGLEQINASTLSEDEKAKARVQFDDDSKAEMSKGGTK